MGPAGSPRCAARYPAAREPRGELRVSRTSLEGEELVIVSYPLAGGRGSLSEAELEVARAAARGLTNAQIARARGASPHTIANQVSAVLQKLQLKSRRQLALALTDPGAAR